MNIKKLTISISLTLVAGYTSAYSIIDKNTTDGGKRQDVYGRCSSEITFTGVKWSFDDYWTISAGSGSTLQRNGLSLDGAIRAVCNE